MEPIDNCIFFKADFTNEKTFSLLKTYLKENDSQIDVILSDMLPNLTGQKEMDHVRSVELCERVFNSCFKLPLLSGGTLLMKILTGIEEKTFVEKLQKHFKSIKTVKPPSSRSESREHYLLCQHFLLSKNNNHNLI